jgi:N-acetylneuraminic acid mutarotase
MNNKFDVLAKGLTQPVTRRQAAKRRGLGLALLSLSLFVVSHAGAGLFLTTGAMNAPREAHTATALPGGEVLVVGGYDDTNNLSSAERYDPKRGTWAVTGRMSGCRVWHTATLLPNGKVLVAGGWDGTNNLSSAEVYDALSGTWAPTGALNTPRYSHTATLLASGRVLVAGGETYNGTTWSSVGTAELYDPVSGTWSFTGGLVEGRESHTATLLGDGKVLVVAGFNENDGVLGSAEMYDPTTGAWIQTRGLVNARFNHTATLLPNGQVLVAGGARCCDPFLLGWVSIPDAELFDPTTGVWTGTGAMNIDRDTHTATLLPNGHVLVAAGRQEKGQYFNVISRAEEYNPATGKWSSTGGVAVERQFHTATLLTDGHVLVVGGYHQIYDTPLASAELYDTRIGGTWTMTGSMSDVRDWDAGTVLTNGQVLVAGGWSAITLDDLYSTERYDFVSGSWVPSGDMIEPRILHAATLLSNGDVLVTGGQNALGGFRNYLSTTELYDPGSGIWTDNFEMTYGRISHTATLLENGQVLVAGGSDGNTPLTSAELYNPEPVAGGWTVTGDLNTPRQGHTATLMSNGQVLVVGGSSDPSAELYDLAKGTWTATSPMAGPRNGHTATVLPSGRVLVSGGATNLLLSAELYDPATGKWTLTGPLNAQRNGHTATLLPNGLVLAAGGDGNQLTSAEIYDPTTGTWTPVAPLNKGRDYHTAALLPNGQVLVVGAFTANNLSTPSAELYDPSPATIPAPNPPTLRDETRLDNGSFQFSFTNLPGAVFSVLASPFPLLPPSDWMMIGDVTETAPGQFQFTDTQATNYPRRFYRLRSP